ncbi:hypothetical protein, membrane [gut metagenome]|uniref:Transmembrane protein n=1 Tax=gut metagenome TaxID=749906 RepID=J9GAI1_9ZZZZ
MNHKGLLSSTFNMSLGFVPVIISIFLCEIITQDIAIYIGSGIGMIGIFLSHRQKKIQVPNFILYLSTVMLTLISLASFIPGDHIPTGALPLTLEVSILIPMLILFLHKKRIINHLLEKINSKHKPLYEQGVEAAVVSARIALLLGIIHFIIISFTIISKGPQSPTGAFILYKILPPTLFIITILLNQLAIHFFNQLLSHNEIIPIVNLKGDVIGKMPMIETSNTPNTHINPVIRIAITTHGMLFLCSRPSTASFEKNKMDIPMETYLKYGETLHTGTTRLINATFPHSSHMKPEFNIVYHFQNEETNRLIYLYIIDMKDDSVLTSCPLKNSKVWNFKQIEENLGKNFFSSCFEEEYEHLKDVICIREKYKEF